MSYRTCLRVIFNHQFGRRRHGSVVGIIRANLAWINHLHGLINDGECHTVKHIQLPLSYQRSVTSLGAAKVQDSSMQSTNPTTGPSNDDMYSRHLDGPVDPEKP